jgi:molybdopterin molybdotransferase
MSNMLSVTEAQRAILSQIKRLDVETVDLLDSLGRVLAEDVASDIDLPPFDNSSMDGYAVRSIDVQGASIDQPTRLPVVADIPAGHPIDLALPDRSAARITTGAMLPIGADTIVPVEDTDDGSRGSSALPSAVSINKAFKRGAFVRYRGDDVKRGEVVLKASAIIHAADIALLASVGHIRVKVYRRPRVAVLATGDELVEPDQTPERGQIRNSNEYAVAALIAQYGGVPVQLGVARDQSESITRKLDQAIGQGVDLIIASAGVSVGAYDFVKDVIASNGAIDLWRVRMRPGKPLAFGNYRGVPFFGLPGNPVSAMLTFEQFVRPVLLVMQGVANWRKPTIDVVLLESIESDGRETYARAIVQREGERWTARLSGGQESNMIKSLSRANALVIMPDGVTHLDRGSSAQAQLLVAFDDIP